MNVKVVAIFALDTIGSVFAQAKLVSSSSLSEWHACARVRENGTQRQKGNSGGTKHGSLAYGNKNGEGADGRLEIARVGIEHGTNARRGKRGGGDGDRDGREVGRPGAICCLSRFGGA